ncbi:hypothetical protein SNE40_011982 [Patella caerulea]|uniref:Uncharacterized protein n=1 Tax=Patella caerulea TaxID=87958 RepID=A0AAN8JRA7_PATCE
MRSLRFQLISKQLNARLTENKTPRTEDVIKIMDEVDNISDEKSLNSFDEAGAGESINNIDIVSIDNEVVFQFFDQNYEIEEHNDGNLSDPITCQELR